MKKVLLIVSIFAILSGTLSAQKFIYPSIPKTGKTVSDFLPPQWKILDSSTVDLNGDKRGDLAMLIEYKKALKDTLDEDNIVDWDPTVLVIFFKDSTDNEYHLALEDHTFIPDEGTGVAYSSGPPGAEVSVSKKGIISISLGYFHASQTYKFRYQDNAFYLIGATNYYDIASAHFDKWDMNFITKKAEHTTGSLDENGKSKTDKIEWKTFDIDKLKTIEELEMAEKSTSPMELFDYIFQ